MSKIQAVGNNVLIEVDTDERITKSGIILPGEQSGLIEAKVVSVGSGDHADYPPPCKDGDSILFSSSTYQFEGRTLVIGEKTLGFLPFHDILGVVVA